MSNTGKLWLLVFVFCAVTWTTPNRAWGQNTNSDLPDSPSAALDLNKAMIRLRSARCPGGLCPEIFSTIKRTSGYSRFNWRRGAIGSPLAVTGVTVGLIVADPHAMTYFRSHAGRLDDLNDIFDAPITTAETIALPASLMLAGYIRHDQYAVSTALLAGEAYADSAIVDLAVKAATRRKRPGDVPPGAPFTDTFFSGGKSPFKGSAFPSGHAAGVFSVATVIAHPLSQTPLRAMGSVRFRNRHQLFSSNHKRSFPIGRFSWSGSRVHHYTV